MAQAGTVHAPTNKLRVLSQLTEPFALELPPDLKERVEVVPVPRGLHIVNIARGGLIDQDALREALDTGLVGGASLDAVTPEPLPAGHWLYSHPRVRLSPHVSWSWPGASATLTAKFAENVRLRLSGKPLVNVIDPEQGY